MQHLEIIVHRSRNSTRWLLFVLVTGLRTEQQSALHPNGRSTQSRSEVRNIVANHSDLQHLLSIVQEMWKRNVGQIRACWPITEIRWTLTPSSRQGLSPPHPERPLCVLSFAFAGLLSIPGRSCSSVAHAVGGLAVASLLIRPLSPDCSSLRFQLQGVSAPCAHSVRFGTALTSRS